MIKTALLISIAISAPDLIAQSPYTQYCYNVQKINNDMEHGVIKIRSKCIDADNWGIVQ